MAEYKVTVTETWGSLRTKNTSLLHQPAWGCEKIGSPERWSQVRKLLRESGSRVKLIFFSFQTIIHDLLFFTLARLLYRKMFPHFFFFTGDAPSDSFSFFQAVPRLRGTSIWIQCIVLWEPPRLWKQITPLCAGQMICSHWKDQELAFGYKPIFFPSTGEVRVKPLASSLPLWDPQGVLHCCVFLFPFLFPFSHSPSSVFPVTRPFVSCHKII